MGQTEAALPLAGRMCFFQGSKGNKPPVGDQHVRVKLDAIPLQVGKRIETAMEVPSAFIMYPNCNRGPGRRMDPSLTSIMIAL